MVILSTTNSYPEPEVSHDVECYSVNVVLMYDVLMVLGESNLYNGRFHVEGIFG